MSLNDDCLIEILSKLRIIDLCEISETCIRLRTLAGYVFSIRYKGVISAALKTTTYHETRRILAIFGTLITELTIEELGIIEPCQLFDLLIQHCGNTLEGLHLKRFKLTNALALKWQTLFTNLKTIEIEECSVHHSMRSIDIFSNCKRLESLAIFRAIMLQERGYEITFPSLKSFTTSLDWLHDFNGVRSFIVCHPHLKKLGLQAEIPAFSDFYSELFDEILNSLKHIEELSIEGCPYNSTEYREHVQRLAELQYLRSLCLDCAGQSISSFLNESKSMATLEFLKLKRTIADDKFFASLANYTSLRRLCLVGVRLVNTIRSINVYLPQLTRLIIEGKVVIGSQYSDTADWLVELVEKLPALEHISLFETSTVLDNDVYLKLVGIVARRSNRATLKVFTNSDIRVDHQNFIRGRNYVSYSGVLSLCQKS